MTLSRGDGPDTKSTFRAIHWRRPTRSSGVHVLQPTVTATRHRGTRASISGRTSTTSVNVCAVPFYLISSVGPPTELKTSTAKLSIFLTEPSEGMMHPCCAAIDPIPYPG